MPIVPDDHNSPRDQGPIWNLYYTPVTIEFQGEMYGLHGFLSNFFPCAAGDYTKIARDRPAFPHSPRPGPCFPALPRSRATGPQKRKRRQDFSCRQAVPAITVPGSRKAAAVRSSPPGSAASCAGQPIGFEPGEDRPVNGVFSYCFESSLSETSVALSDKEILSASRQCSTISASVTVSISKLRHSSTGK